MIARIMRKFSEREYKPHYERLEGDLTIYRYADEECSEVEIVVDADDNILSETMTGECACGRCLG